MTILKILFIIASFLIIGSLGAVEWNIYRRRIAASPAQETPARRRLRRRGLGLFLLLIELCLFVFYNTFASLAPSPWLSLAYLFLCVIIALDLFWVVIVDVRVSLAEILKTETDIADLHAAKLEAEIQKILAEQGLDAPGAKPRPGPKP